ncbi:ISKra4 family transposase [Thermodesulfobacteriota bacterium]
MEANILEARDEFNGILEFVRTYAIGCEIHQVEQDIFRRLLLLGRCLLEIVLFSSGTGKEGPVIECPDGSIKRYQRKKVRQYLSIFGKLTVRRAYYLGDDGKGICPLDAKLNLPKRLYSYVLQQWMSGQAVETTYESAANWIQRVLGIDLAHRPVERVVLDMTDGAEEFIDSLEAPPPQEEGPILVETMDRKGIPMCKSNPDQVKTPDKPGKKKMALVTATLSVDPYERPSVEEIADRLVNEGAKTPLSKTPRRPKPHQKRIIASLAQQGSTVMNKAQGSAISRIGPNTSFKAVVADGEKSLWNFADVLFPGWIQVLDIIHVRDKLWLAAHLYYKKKSPDAREYVRERLVALFTGQVNMIIEDFRISMEDGSLSARKVETLRRKVLGYFINNRDRMKYDKYLAMGLPIGSGVIEGSCKNLINDRMERSGMRWSEEGAEAMIRLRGLFLTDLWEPFWTFRIEREKRLLYGSCLKDDRIPVTAEDLSQAA